MEKLNEIDEFLKFYPKQNLSEEVEGSKNKNGNRNGSQNNSKLQNKNSNENNGVVKNNNQAKNPLSIKEINEKLKEKMGNFNTNARKNNPRKRPPRRGRGDFDNFKKNSAPDGVKIENKNISLTKQPKTTNGNTESSVKTEKTAKSKSRPKSNDKNVEMK